MFPHLLWGKTQMESYRSALPLTPAQAPGQETNRTTLTSCIYQSWEHFGSRIYLFQDHTFPFQ